MTTVEAAPVGTNTTLKRAVLYLRVSTVSQVKTDYDPEGISIPAQRDACMRKAAQMGVEVIDEYIEPGKSGTSMDKRPAFQMMLQRLRTKRDVDYVIVYKLSRLNRNRVDDAQVLMLLRARKVTLVSATESIDETPVGQLMHGILASFNEFRSAEDGADIRYKMGEKAKRGGTLGKAPIGYLNVRERFEGREVRTVIQDAERAPLIQQAFELYASGDYTLERLQGALTDQGLLTRPTSSRPAQPISISKLHLMLSDPYYMGVIVWKGEEYPARHEPLVSPQLFERVQQVLELRHRPGLRDVVHNHYLRGQLFCARCHAAGRESRMLYSLAKGRNEYYAYYFCRGRQQGVCDLPHLPVAEVEAAVLKHYAQLRLPDDFASTVRTEVQELVDDRQRATATLHANLANELKRLDVREERLLDLAEEDGLPQAKIRARMTKLRQERERIAAQVGSAEDQLSLGREILITALDLLRTPQELYRQAADEVRRQLNSTFFERFYVEDEGAVDGVFAPPFDEIDDARQVYYRAASPADLLLVTKKKHPSEAEVLLQVTGVGLLACGLADHGSSKAALVEIQGLKPWTSALPALRSNQLSYIPII